MKVFEHMNLSNGHTCLVCKRAQDRPVILIGVAGTEEGGNMQAKQVHVDCIDLLYYPEMDFIAQKL